MLLTNYRVAALMIGIVAFELFVRYENSGGEDIPKLEMYSVSKRSMLVGMSETTEEVCESVIRPGFKPAVGHMVNGSFVEILQNDGYEFRKTYVHCSRRDRPACHGIREDKYISECVTVFENVNAMVRLLNTTGPFKTAMIRVPIFCECRLRRQYRSFRRDDNDDEDDSE
ncbi:unnamed protein product [Caenorhabditis brenneri]